MAAKLTADALVLFHFAFILFVIGGGFLVRRWFWVVWVHIPCAIWGALIEFAGWICPLTPLENNLRISAGYSGYSGGFIENYIIPIVYPAGLTYDIQILCGLGVVIINIWAYNFIWWHPLLYRLKNIN
jgi:Protein of Unknown function (DUF2784)